MNSIEGVHHLMLITGLADAHDPAGSFLLAFVELEEHGGTGSFSMGEAVEEGQVRVVRKRTKLVEKVLGRPIKGYINNRSSLSLRGSDEIQAEDRGQTPGRIVPNHVVPNEKPAQQAIQLA